MSYPSDWHIASCRSCTDPKAPSVFVDFFPPSGSGGWVMVQPLADKPLSKSMDEWLAEVAKTANLNTHSREERIALNGLVGLKVRYQTAVQDEMEEVYVVSGRKTFSITFSEDQNSTHLPLEKLTNYTLYLKMLASFQAPPR